MRKAGLPAPPVMYVPQDEEDYYMQTGKLPKALAAHAAQADLNGVRVPTRQDDGSYKDAQGADTADYFARLRTALLKDLLLLLFLLLIILLLLLHNL